MTDRRPLAAAAAALLPALGLLAAGAGLDAFGKARRTTGPARTLGDPALIRLTVNTADEAYSVWRERAQRGRVAVALGRRLYFVEQLEDTTGALAAGRPVDPADRWEQALRPENFLLVAMERGLVREVRQVVPEAVFADKAEQAAGLEGVRVAATSIAAPHYGSPRLITTLDAFARAGAPAEPVLLFVSASTFRTHPPRLVLERLRAAGLTTDLAVLCRSLDDPEVTDGERVRLAEFTALLEPRGP